MMRAYKFLDARYGKKDIVERRVKVSTFADMNDPFELIGVRWRHSGVEQMLTTQHNSGHGVTCLSRNCADPLLWAHYADKHRGICLGFDIPDDPNKVRPVIYAGERELLDPHSLLRTLRADASPESLADARETVIRKLLLKYEGWNYEDEVRMFYRLEKGMTFHDFDEDFTLKEVILGLRCAVTKRSVLNWLNGYNREVEILKAELSPDSFRIVPIPL
jgi:hypothetical protein